MCPAPCRLYFFNYRATFFTRLAITIIHFKKIRVVAFLSRTIQKIPKRSAAMFDGGLQNFGNADKYFFLFGFRNRTDTAHGADAGAKTNFIDVNVAEAGDEFLVEEQGFESGIFSFDKKRGEISESK